ncbi:cysteine desulfurase [Clostridiales bacterium PH28_bin88]|nr:cysteine desulfurase [Clostridiales bacterium PH28_bin88]
MKQEIYLDNSATTRALPEVVQAVSAALENNYGNPSSLHGKGVAAERAVRQARAAVASLLGVKAEEIFFTSGGTEANNWALRGVALSHRRRGNHVITTVVEHPSVLRACQELEAEGYQVTYLPVDRTGEISPDDLASALTPETILVSVMHVNNEVGAVQPLQQVGALLRKREPKPVFHVDAIQGYGKLPLNPYDLGIDLVSVSAHKIHGPKGVGALFIREGVRLKPLLVGGEQEANLRAGTENVPGIVGLGSATAAARGRMSQGLEHMRGLKTALASRVMGEIPGTRLNGPSPEQGAPHILNLSFPGVKGEVLIHTLETDGIYVSTGSACHSRRNDPSHVLVAMGLKKKELDGAIRFSFSHLNTPEEIDMVVERLAEAVRDLRSL